MLFSGERGSKQFRLKFFICTGSFYLISVGIHLWLQFMFHIHVVSDVLCCTGESNSEVAWISLP